MMREASLTSSTCMLPYLQLFKGIVQHFGNTFTSQYPVRLVKNGRSSARLLLAVCSFMFNVRTFARKQMSTFSRMFTYSFMFEDQETVKIKRYMYLRKLSPTITLMTIYT